MVQLTRDRNNSEELQSSSTKSKKIKKKTKQIRAFSDTFFRLDRKTLLRLTVCFYVVCPVADISMVLCGQMFLLNLIILEMHGVCPGFGVHAVGQSVGSILSIDANVVGSSLSIDCPGVVVFVV